MSWLSGRKSSVPEAEVIYAIGDIHGRDDLLAKLHAMIEEELAEATQQREVTVVYLGDYVDRGPDSRAVIDRLLNRPIAGARSIYLKGNHEDAMLRFIAGEAGGQSWLSIGGGATAKSYDVPMRPGEADRSARSLIRKHLRERVPERHMAFLRDLRMLYEAGDYLFVHAGIRPGRALEEQSPQDLLWIRREFLTSRRNHGRIIVHGHSASGKTVVKRNRICVDTAAYATDCLSCVVLEGRSRRFISAAL